MIRFFTSIGGFLLGAILFAFLLTISFNPNFFAKVMLKDFAKSIAQPATNSLDKFLDDSVLEPILDSPQTLTSLGLHQLDFLTNHNENLDDYSVEKSESDHEKFLAYYEKLNNFDYNFYISNYTDLKHMNYIQACCHYLMHGIKENRNCNNSCIKINHKIDNDNFYLINNCVLIDSSKFIIDFKLIIIDEQSKNNTFTISNVQKR